VSAPPLAAEERVRQFDRRSSSRTGPGETPATSEPFRATAPESQTWIFGIGEPTLPVYQQFISICYQSATFTPVIAGADFGRSEQEANYQTISVIHREARRPAYVAIYENLLFSIFFIDFL
jgi:hypothetical protein